MSYNDWHRHLESDVAVDEILDAAGRAFADLGVAKTTMVDICGYAGCSRATLYRYFENRRALQLAYVNRASLGIAAAMAGLPRRSDTDLVGALTDRVLAGIAGVRSDPLLAVWFEPENLAVPIAMSQDSEVLAALAASFIDTGGPGPIPDRAAVELRGSWLIRSIVAMLAMPAEDEATERALIETFLVPALLDHSTAEPAR